MKNNIYLPKPYKIISVKAETEIDYTYVIEKKEALIGGQFMEISIPGVGEAPISISDFDDDTLSMTIRKVGRLTDVIFDLKAGDTLFMRGPYGNGFDLESYEDSKLIVIAGGTGLAPVKNVIQHYVTNNSKLKSFQVITGFKSPNDLLFEKDLKNWADTIDLTVTVDAGDKQWKGDVGLVTTHISNLDLTTPKNTKAIVVGPPMMMKFTTLELIKQGVLEDNITVSFERKMSCGVGKCGHCKIDETYVCLEGPVFNYVEAKKLLD